MSRKATKGFSEKSARYRATRTVGRASSKAVRQKRRLPEPEQLPDGTVRHFLVMGPKGRVLFPAELRNALGLAEGDIITAWVKDAEVRMQNHRDGLRQILEQARQGPAGRNYASEELIAERRAENAKQDKESLQWLRAAKKKPD